jgi:hypothetical protein
MHQPFLCDVQRQSSIASQLGVLLVNIRPFIKCLWANMVSPSSLQTAGLADEECSSSMLQDIDALDVSFLDMILHALISVFLTPICNLVEGVILIWTIFRPVHGFYVVKKI